MSLVRCSCAPPNHCSFASPQIPRALVARRAREPLGPATFLQYGDMFLGCQTAEERQRKKTRLFEEFGLVGEHRSRTRRGMFEWVTRRKIALMSDESSCLSGTAAAVARGHKSVQGSFLIHPSHTSSPALNDPQLLMRIGAAQLEPSNVNSV